MEMLVNLIWDFFKENKILRFVWRTGGVCVCGRGGGVHMCVPAGCVCVCRRTYLKHICVDVMCVLHNDRVAP